MPNEKNLKPWKPGQSGNPKGKPKGAKHLSTRIKNMLQDETFEQKLSDGTIMKGAPVDVLIRALIVRAEDLLIKKPPKRLFCQNGAALLERLELV